MSKVAAVANLDTYQIDIHREGCPDLKKVRHEVDIIEEGSEVSWAQTVFGEVEEDVWDNPQAFIRVMPCSKK
jgi:hypothetical protein